MVITNQQDNSGTSNIDSAVYKWDMEAQVWIIYIFFKVHICNPGIPEHRNICKTILLHYCIRIKF